MKKLRTHVYRRTYRSGKVVWIVRWWDQNESRWKTSRAGNTSEEAKIIEATLRLDILKGIDPLQKQERVEVPTIGDLIDQFYKSPRFLANSLRWQHVMKCHLEGPIRQEFGSPSVTTRPATRCPV